MNVLRTLLLGGLATAAIGQAHAMDDFATVQEPQQAMDEIVVSIYEVVVTAPAPSSTPGQDALAVVAAALEAHVREIVAAAQQPRSFVTKISSNGRIYFAPWRI